jgi:hypothetical protein
MRSSKSDTYMVSARDVSKKMCAFEFFAIAVAVSKM